MIFDNIRNYELYAGGKNNLKEAFELISCKKFENLPGRYELENGLYYLVQSYETKPLSEGRFEAHRKYIDLQYIAYGKERHDAACICDLTQQDEYNSEKDIIFYNGSGSTLIINEGFFAVYFPQDAHMPNLRVGGSPEKVTKIVIKIPYS